MVFVFLSICCSVIVSVLLKLARRYEIDIPQAVFWNYPVAALLTFLIYKPDLKVVSIEQSQMPVYLLLAVLLPLLFVVLGMSVRYTGIVRTDLAQRLSLFIPLLTSFLLFREHLSSIKIAGMVLGFIAIVCTIPWQKSFRRESHSASLFFPTVVFFGMGLIDVLFKQVAANNVMPYTTSIFIVFCMAFVVSLLVYVIGIVSERVKFNWVNFFSGLILGFFNFGNILFYLKAHRALPDNPSIVFSAMNIGVIVIGAVLGVFLFREKLSFLNKAGIIVAIAAILIISYGQ